MRRKKRKRRRTAAAGKRYAAQTAKRLAGNQHFTQPPPRYTEASLIKALEENGIGRPSTYAATISTITGREYVVREGKTLKPTELGEVYHAS